MSKPKLLITGANGLIGQIIIQELEHDFDISGLDKTSSSNNRICKTDIVSEEEVRNVFDELSPIAYVIHLAADPRSDADWQSVLMNNIHGTWNVFLVASQYEVRRIVFASSNHVTGYYEGVPPNLHLQKNPPMIFSSNPVRPDGPYGISKISGEAIARYFYDSSGLEAVCLRIGSVIRGDDPTKSDRHQSTWLSHRDLKHLIRRSLFAGDKFPGFGIYYGVSNNSNRFWDISIAKEELGFRPQDNAAAL